MLDDRSFTATVDANGDATVLLKTRTRLQRWMLQQITCDMPTAPVGAVCEIRRNGLLITPLIASGDVADGDPYVLLRGSDSVTVKWSNCTPGDVGTVLAIFDDGTEQR